jgi:alpha-tubulin suppressor-like RCC1 family protein
MNRTFVAALFVSLTPMLAGADYLTDVIEVTGGGFHTCARTTTGAVSCWGKGEFGATGHVTYEDVSVPTPVIGYTPNGPTAGVGTAVSAGGHHTCALSLVLGAQCWGLNSSGQLGNGTTDTSASPQDVAGLASGVVAITAGVAHSCALVTGGGVKCWGENGGGQLGDGTTTGRSVPGDVTGLASGVAGISAGDRHTCVLTTGGGVKCWGKNDVGQLGDGTTTDRFTPGDVPGLTSGIVAIAAGWKHTCAITTGGGAKCWGDNVGDQLGIGSAINTYTPLDVTGLTSGVAAISAGQLHTCAVTTSGGVKCWGFNIWGQLGDGTFGTRRTPTDVSGLTSGATGITAGQSHGCAIVTQGRVMCWGQGFAGQLGNGAIPVMQNTPVLVGTATAQTITFAGLPNHDVHDAPFTVSATASSGLAVSFSSLSTHVCTVSGANVTLLEIGICTIAADQAGNATYAPAPQVARSFRVTGVPTGAPPRLAQISTRMQVQTGENVLIAGFIIAGANDKTVVVRARGPSLTGSGVPNALANPVLQVYSGQTPIATNDDWQSGTQANTIQQIGLAPADASEAAVLITLQPNRAYSAIVRGIGATTGVAIVEVFEIDRPETPLINIATRGQVLTGNDVMIAGFVIQGNGPQTVVVRARGPSLVPTGITNPLANPVLQLFSGQTQLAVNDDWGTAANAAQLQASGFAPSEAVESAILITLQPGAYTAIVTGAGGTTGVGLVEVFAQ